MDSTPHSNAREGDREREEVRVDRVSFRFVLYRVASRPEEGRLDGRRMTGTSTV